MTKPRWNKMHWQSDDRFSLDGVNFWLTTTEYRTPSTNQQFVFLKDKGFLESYRTLFDELRPTRLLEIGFFHGAGAAFYSLLLHPQKLVCVDLVMKAPVLKHYIRRRKCRNVVPYYGIDQADKEAMVALLEREFPRRDLDMAIDDASHMYYPARASFEAVFPYLREDGMYVIEDWGWAHWQGAWQDPEGPIIPGPGLSNLIFELVMTQATSPDVIKAVHIDYYRVAVVRGPRDLSGAPIDLSQLYVSRGQPPSLV